MKEFPEIRSCGMGLILLDGKMLEAGKGNQIARHCIEETATETLYPWDTED
jgi:hypothetical protein